ncbi:MAG: biotin/lipoate A/B protein ligase family protein [Pirellulales bacterium]
MQRLILTLDTPEQNLALDEALLDLAEQGGLPGGLLRLWESAQRVVVLGRSSRFGREVDREACHQQGVRVLRRSSGGASIVAGPGCLMYSVVVDYAAEPHLRAIDQAHSFVLDRHVQALRWHLPDVARKGTSDLTVGERKFSGNSLRAKRRALLYHGTLLYDFPLAQIPRFLKLPPRQPDYRRDRQHIDFVMNVPLDRCQLQETLIEAWHADEDLLTWPRDAIDALVRCRYGCQAWTEEF